MRSHEPSSAEHGAKVTRGRPRRGRGLTAALLVAAAASTALMPQGARGQAQALFQWPVDFASPPAPDTGRYERCKATHRCNRAHAAFDLANASWSFTKQIFAGGLHEDASAFLNFENWEAGTMGLSVDPGYLAKFAKPAAALVGALDDDGAWNGTSSAGPLFNSFDWPLHAQRLYLNHSAAVLIDTDAATLTVVHMGPPSLAYALPTLNATGGLELPDPRLVVSLDNMLYRPEPPSDETFQGELAATPAGSPVALFNFGSLYLGPTVLVNTTGSRPLVLLSRSSAVLDTPVVVYPGTLGGFPGARNVSLLGGVGANEHGPGSGSKRVLLATVQASAADVDEVQQIETFVRSGQTLRGFFVLSFKGRVTHPIRAGAEPEELRDRVLAAFPEAGEVRVTRSSGLTSRGGYLWNVTFVRAVGNQPQLEASGRGLTGIGAGVDARTLTDGNDVGGSFQLEWAGLETAAIPVNATAEELRKELERAWGSGRGLSHAHVVRSNSVARRSDVCADGECPSPFGPGPAWGVTWLLTLSFEGGAAAGGEAVWASPAGADAGAALPLRPVRLSPSWQLAGAGANVTLVPGHTGRSPASQSPTPTLSAGAELPPHEFEALAAMSLAFGGAGASSGGTGGIGHARHGPVSPAPLPRPLFDLLGGSGGAMGGEVPQQPLSVLGPAHVQALRLSGQRSCADPPLPWDGAWQAQWPIAANTSNSSSGCPGAGGAGGGAVAIYAVNDLVIGPSGGVVADGADAEDGWRGGGGGAGGSVMLGAGGALVIQAPVSARGGNGGRGVGIGSRGGGGGWGGVVSGFAQSLVADGPSFRGPSGGERAFDSAAGVAAVSAAGGAGGLDESVLPTNATFNASLSTAEERRQQRAAALAARQRDLEATRVASLRGVGSLLDEAMGVGAPGGVPTGPRSLAAASGQDGPVSLLAASGVQYRVDARPGPGAQGGAEDTQRCLLVRVGETALPSGVEPGSAPLRAPFAHNGPSFSLPVANSGRWWARRGANSSLPPGAPPALADALAGAPGGPPSSLGEDYAGLGGSGLDGSAQWNNGSRPERVTAYIRMGLPAYGDASTRWGPHFAIHETDFRNLSSSNLRGSEGNAAPGATGGGGPGGPAAPYGVGAADDPGDGGGVGGDAAVMIGVGVVDGRWAFGSNYRHSPTQEPAAGSAALVVTRAAEAGRWYKIDVLISWTNHTFRVRIDDVTVALDVPFTGSAVRRLGMYMFEAGEAWFDEVYAGPDDTLGFECPQAASDGSLRMSRPVQSGWLLSDIGEDSFDWEITRHENHVSRRPVYTHESHGGIVFGDGAPHRRFHRDIKTVAADGDHNATHGAIHAAAMLFVPGDSPPRDLLARAMTTAGSMRGEWGAASTEQARLSDSQGGREGYGSIQSIDGRDGFGGPPGFGGLTGRYYWYGEHDSITPGLAGRDVSHLIPPSQAENDGLQHPLVSRGGVAACSTNDLLVWRNEGIMYRFENISLPEGDRLGPVNASTGELFAFRSERPKTVFNNNTASFVMWQYVDDAPARQRRAAGVATSAWPNGPFVWEHSLYPDGNETTDLTVFADAGTGTALLARTYYETTHYWLPKPIMQPVWESVKKEDGTTDFSLNFHRAFYHQGYDNPDDIYLQRWRLEDKPWNITVGAWTETWDNDNEVFKLLNLNGDSKTYPAGSRQAVLDDTFDRYTLREINGQGRPPILSRYLSPNASENNAWSPSSVPAVKAQPWMQNYEDKNIADNPPHPTVPDLLIGLEHIVESRRTKYVAISLLNANFTRTAGEIRVFEGEMEGQQDLITVFGQGGRFGWGLANGSHERTTYGFDINGRSPPFGFHTQLDWEDRHWQYTTVFNDRFRDFRNFRDRQTSSECPDIHHKSIAKKDECLFILNNVLAYEDSPPLNNSKFDLQSYARALDTQLYEDCLAQHRELLSAFQNCTRKSIPVYELSEPVGVGSRECVGGGGQCGPPALGEDALLDYGFSANAPNYTKLYGVGGFQRPREHWGPTMV